jgi:hypothetical protein
MNETQQTVIPAAPGWNIVDIPIGEKHPDLCFNPVIAWLVNHVDGNAFARPVTIEGTWPVGSSPIIQRPDGLFSDGCRTYFSKEDVITEFQRRIDIMNQPGIAAMSKGRAAAS